jgi:hypothetical protein
MSKGAIIAGGAVLAVVVIGGAALAFASTPAPSKYPNLGPPPPPPPDGTLGSAIAQLGAGALDKLGHNDVVKTLTDSESAGSYVAKNVATGGLYSVYAGAKGVLSKIF